MRDWDTGKFADFELQQLAMGRTITFSALTISQKLESGPIGRFIATHTHTLGVSSLRTPSLTQEMRAPNFTPKGLSPPTNQTWGPFRASPPAGKSVTKLKVL